jgi:hypothetical protein
MPVELSIDQQALQALGRALKAEADGKKLRRDLIRRLRKTMEPIREQAQSNALGIESAGLSTSEGPGLRAAVADQIKTQVRLAGRVTGIRLHAPKRRGMPRGFVGAPKALNRKKGWRRRVYGGNVWVQQVATPPEFFDEAHRGEHKQLKRDVLAAMNDAAVRVAAKGPFTSRG